jgi:hypothetical protein
MVTQGDINKQAKLLQKHVERRDRLWLELRAQNPSYTEMQIEARLEQFGC